jgi:hypothetical protein
VTSVIPAAWAKDLWFLLLLLFSILPLWILPLILLLLYEIYKTDYYESGADMGLSEDMFESFLKYQAMLGKEFRRMQKKYGLVPINGNRTPEEIHSDLRVRKYTSRWYVRYVEIHGFQNHLSVAYWDMDNFQRHINSVIEEHGRRNNHDRSRNIGKHK